MPNPALRYKSLWLQLGIAGLVTLAVIALWPYRLDASAPVWTDKVLHISAYIVASGWFFQIFHQTKERLFVFAGLLLYGLCIEGAQHFAPMRSTSFLDLVANMSGVLIGWMLCLTPLQFILQNIDQRLPVSTSR